MAHSSVSRTLAATERYPVQVFGRGVWKREGKKQKIAPAATIVVVEQWICFTLGLVCVAFGVGGIVMTPRQHALSTYIAWLGSLYVPTLRVTAVVCLGLGVMLIRLGWEGP
jgi:hypothetical protein